MDLDEKAERGEPRTPSPWWKVVACLVGVLAVYLALYITVGMVNGINPMFDKGRSPVPAIIVQEAVGVMTLVALALLLRQLRSIAHGKSLGVAALTLLAALVLTALWIVAFLIERGS